MSSDICLWPISLSMPISRSIHVAAIWFFLSFTFYKCMLEPPCFICFNCGLDSHDTISPLVKKTPGWIDWWLLGSLDKTLVAGRCSPCTLSVWSECQLLFGSWLLLTGCWQWHVLFKFSILCIPLKAYEFLTSESLNHLGLWIFRNIYLFTLLL